VSTLFGRMKQAFGEWSRRYICDEDPDERQMRLKAEALQEINAQILPVLQLRMAMHRACESEPESKRELEAA